MPADRIPDVILVRKIFNRAVRQRRRQWKLRRLADDGRHLIPETASMENDYESFLDDVEEDAVMRQKINIYRDQTKTMAIDEDDEGEDLPEGPSLQEMLDDLVLDDEPMQSE
jgi:nonsense-mediated mRNA decay protein 3